MNPLILPLALACAFALAGIALSSFVLLNLRTTVRGMAEESARQRETFQSEIAALRTRIDELAAHEVRERQEAISAAGPVRPGLNLNKRASALRMHRRGDAPRQIAATLDIPLQEVDLLLKVHQIVMQNI